MAAQSVGRRRCELLAEEQPTRPCSCFSATFDKKFPSQAHRRTTNDLISLLPRVTGQMTRGEGMV